MKPNKISFHKCLFFTYFPHFGTTFCPIFRGGHTLLEGLLGDEVTLSFASRDTGFLPVWILQMLIFPSTALHYIQLIAGEKKS